MLANKYGKCVYPIGSMYAIYAKIEGILMVNVTIYSIHGSYGYCDLSPDMSGCSEAHRMPINLYLSSCDSCVWSSCVCCIMTSSQMDASTSSLT